MTTFLVATDGSPASQDAVELGVELAEKCDGAVVFVHVVRPPEVLAMNGFGLAGVGPAEPTEHEHEVLDSAEAFAEHHGVRSRSIVLYGEPAAEISSYADSIRADVTIVGCRGLRALGRALWGSVSRELLSASRLPVVVVQARS